MDEDLADDLEIVERELAIGVGESGDIVKQDDASEHTEEKD